MNQESYAGLYTDFVNRELDFPPPMFANTNLSKFKKKKKTSKNMHILATNTPSLLAIQALKGTGKKKKPGTQRCRMRLIKAHKPRGVE